jgi:hypothetical protein
MRCVPFIVGEQLMKRTGWTIAAVLFLASGHVEAAERDDAECKEEKHLVGSCTEAAKFTCSAAKVSASEKEGGAKDQEQKQTMAQQKANGAVKKCNAAGDAQRAQRCAERDRLWDALGRANEAARQARAAATRAVNEEHRVCGDMEALCSLARERQNACTAHPRYVTPPLGTDVILGFQLSDAAQLRFPRMDGVPSSMLANVAAFGVVLQWGHLEVMPEIFLLGTTAKVTNAGTNVSESATGIGGGGGLRVAVGWADAVGGGFYFSLFPSLSAWKLGASSGGQSIYSANATELGVDLGFGYKIQLNSRARLDIFAQAFRFGVRPQQQSTVDFTTYPTLGVGIDLFPAATRWPGKSDP